VEEENVQVEVGKSGKLVHPPMPETERMLKARLDLAAQEVSEFLAWVGSADGPGAVLCTISTSQETGEEEYRPLEMPVMQLLARYAEIDLNKVDAERQAQLEYLRADAEARGMDVSVEDGVG